MRYEGEEDQVIIVERGGTDLGTLLVGVLIGAGVALLFAPQSGEETRRVIGQRARAATDAVRDAADNVTGQVVETFENARNRVEEEIDSVRTAVVRKKRQMSRAMDAGREAAEQARGDLELRLAQTKAAYNAGAGVAKSARRPLDDGGSVII